ncbi:MAG: hypothetical protein ABIV28_05965 [Longimicrobiales bacterium]
MYDLTRLSLSAMTDCSTHLRRLGQRASSMEEVAGEVARFLYDNIGVGDQRACALARVYKTHPLGQLPEELQDFARSGAGTVGLHQLTKCLTLLATVGDEAAWNDRRSSRLHQAIPLPSPQTVEQAPMVAQLMRQLGLDIAQVLSPDPALLIDMSQTTFNVFHVQHALGSPFIPAQDFVTTHGIASVLGFGGVFPTGDLFCVILFSRAAIPPTTAELFKPLALAVKVALVPFAGEQVFA